MTIQQSLNQMLMSAQIGAGLYKQTPEAKSRAELKTTIKRESETESVISNQLEKLREEAEGAGEISPEIETALKGILQEQTALTKQQFRREPEYLENYLSALQDEEMLKTQGRLGLRGWQGLRTTAERQQNLQSQKQEIKTRRQFLENPEQAPRQRNAFVGRQAEESRIMAHNKPNAFTEQQKREKEEMRNGK